MRSAHKKKKLSHSEMSDPGFGHAFQRGRLSVFQELEQFYRNGIALTSTQAEVELQHAQKIADEAVQRDKTNMQLHYINQINQNSARHNQEVQKLKSQELRYQQEIRDLKKNLKSYEQVQESAKVSEEKNQEFESLKKKCQKLEERSQELERTLIAQSHKQNELEQQVARNQKLEERNQELERTLAAQLHKQSELEQQIARNQQMAQENVEKNNQLLTLQQQIQQLQAMVVSQNQQLQNVVSQQHPRAVTQITPSPSQTPVFNNRKQSVSAIRVVSPSCWLSGIPNGGLKCFFNSAMQCMKPAILTLLQRAQKSQNLLGPELEPYLQNAPVTKAVINLFEAQQTDAPLKELFNVVQRHPSFAEIVGINKAEMDDAMNVIREVLFVISDELQKSEAKFFDVPALKIYNKFTLETATCTCQSCGLKVPGNKLLYAVLKEQDMQKAMKSTFDSFKECPRPTCKAKKQKPFKNIPEVIVVRAAADHFAVPNNIVLDLTLEEVHFGLVSVVLSSGNHATCLARYNGNWYKFDDGNTPIELREVNFNYPNHKYLCFVFQALN